MNSEVISMIKERLEKGKREYNEELDIHDGRDWVEEALEEVLDGLVYLTAKLLQIKEREKNEKI